MRNKCFATHGDPWNVVGRLHPMRHLAANEPKTTRKVNAWQMYVWEDFDKYAEDYGADYTVVNRDIYYFDTHLRVDGAAPARRGLHLPVPTHRRVRQPVGHPWRRHQRPGLRRGRHRATTPSTGRSTG